LAFTNPADTPPGFLRRLAASNRSSRRQPSKAPDDRSYLLEENSVAREALLVKLQNYRVHDPIGERLPHQRREASAFVGDDPAAARERVENIRRSRCCRTAHGRLRELA
jgi:hypothetical protein